MNSYNKIDCLENRYNKTDYVRPWVYKWHLNEEWKNCCSTLPPPFNKRVALGESLFGNHSFHTWQIAVQHMLLDHVRMED